MKHLRTDQAVLVVYETGDVKKGTDTVGAQRQHTGTSGPRPPTAAGPPGLVTRPNSRPNRSLPPVWSPDAWTPPTGPPGSRETRSAAATRRYAPRWKNAAPATSSRWPGRTKSPQAPGSAKGQRLYDWAVIDLTYLEYQGVSPRSREPIGRPTAVAQRGAPQRSRRTGKMCRTRSRPLRRS
ncbi:hypothetical protein [Streptomyces zaomyceticus]|uniref:hypothetical protein n=1 Tax=Streptomyces zaomyceticus TaxID=68286 RepID=UPI0036A2538C